MQGFFHVEHLGPGGKLLGTRRVKNKITNAAKTYILDVMLALATETSGFWHVGLIDGSWNDFTNGTNPDPITANEFEDYDEVTRVQIDTEFAAATSGGGYAYIQNNISTDPVTFTISTGVTSQILDGIFIIDNAAKGAAASYRIWCTGAFGNVDATPAPITVNAGDTVKVSYKCQTAL